MVSIHAPAKGATNFCRHTYNRCLVSIHAPAKGATHADFTIASINLFQSTHPRRVRHSFNPEHVSINCFNPRTREGCDVRTPYDGTDLPVSIHAPAKGATKNLTDFENTDPVSIHAPAKGATIGG